MKAARVVARHRIEIADVPAPVLTDQPPGSLIVEPILSAICGSDMPGFDLPRPASDYPLPPGLTVHECIGVVRASDSRRLRPGDEVLALPRGGGALAERYVSHESVAVPVPASAPREYLLMAQPLGTVIWAMRKLGNLLGQDAVVLGQGPNGLLLSRMLGNLGARRIVAVDPHHYRLGVSKRMHATHTVNAVGEEAIEAVLALTGGRGADLVIEAVGHQMQSINEAVQMVRRGGTLLAFGVPDEKLYEIRYGDLFRKNLTLIGSVIPDAQRDFPLALDLIAQGRVDVAPMLTHRLAFTEAQRGMELALHKRDGAIKIVFEYP